MRFQKVIGPTTGRGLFSGAIGYGRHQAFQFLLNSLGSRVFCNIGQLKRESFTILIHCRVKKTFNYISLENIRSQFVEPMTQVNGHNNNNYLIIFQSIILFNPVWKWQ